MSWKQAKSCFRGQARNSLKMSGFAKHTWARDNRWFAKGERNEGTFLHYADRGSSEIRLNRPESRSIIGVPAFCMDLLWICYGSAVDFPGIEIVPDPAIPRIYSAGLSTPSSCCVSEIVAKSTQILTLPL